jgi:hypothetical protein
VRNGDERVTRELLAGEALYILRNLKDNKAGGRSNKLADVKSSLEPTVTLEFDNYFFFLRKYNYIAMDREACLQLTGDGEKVLDGPMRERFGDTVGEYFASRLGDEPAGLEPPRASRPPPPPPPNTNSDPVSPIRLSADAVIAESSNDNQNTSPFDAPASASASPTSPFEPPAPIATPLSTPAMTTASMSAAPSPLNSAASSLTPPKRNSRPTPTRTITSDSEPAVPQPPRPMEVPRAPGANNVGGGSQELDGRYTKSDSMGGGPLGQVFRGKHMATGVDLAVKELKDIFGYFSFLQRNEVIKRIRKELQGQAQVRHPAVVQILDMNLDNARPYYVLELCAGGSLRDEMEETENKGLKVEQAIRYFLQMCYGLRAAHASGLTHQNLKPENVLIDHLGNAKLSDFGLTRVIEVDSVKGMPQVYLGTGGMGYLPPELMARQKGVGASADVYSLGILFYEMLTGSLPGRRSPLPSQARKDVPEKLDAIFDKMTQDRKEERLPDVDAVLNEFYGAFNNNEWLKRGDMVLWSESAASGGKLPNGPETT